MAVRALPGLVRRSTFQPSSPFSALRANSLGMTSRAAASTSEGAADDKKCYVLLYDYVPDIAEKRGPYREEHLARARSELDAGRMVLAGAYSSPLDGAAFVFRLSESERHVVDDFVAHDPYYKNGAPACPLLRAQV